MIIEASQCFFVLKSGDDYYYLIDVFHFLARMEIYV